MYFIILFSSAYLCAIISVVCLAHSSGKRAALAWWLPLTLVLGPLAALIWLVRLQPRTFLPEPARPGISTAATRSPFEDGPPTTPLQSGIYLLVADGCDQDRLRSSEVPSSGSLIVRRARRHERSIAQMLLLHDSGVSRHCHCRLRLAGSAIEVADSSRNGTFVDNMHICQSTATVAIGSEIRVGTTTLVLRDARSQTPTLRTGLAPATHQPA